MKYALQDALHIIAHMADMKFLDQPQYRDRYTLVFDNGNNWITFETIEEHLNLLKDYMLFGRLTNGQFFYCDPIKIICDKVPRHILRKVCSGDYDDVMKYSLIM